MFADDEDDAALNTVDSSETGSATKTAGFVALHSFALKKKTNKTHAAIAIANTQLQHHNASASSSQSRTKVKTNSTAEVLPPRDERYREISGYKRVSMLGSGGQGMLMSMSMSMVMRVFTWRFVCQQRYYSVDVHIVCDAPANICTYLRTHRCICAYLCRIYIGG